jgi:hypothetical protein
MKKKTINSTNYLSTNNVLIAQIIGSMDICHSLTFYSLSVVCNVKHLAHISVHDVSPISALMRQ